MHTGDIQQGYKILIDSSNYHGFRITHVNAQPAQSSDNYLMQAVSTKSNSDFVDKNDKLKNNLSAAAHLIHESSENRFKITYSPGFLTKEEIESVNFRFADINSIIKKYDPKKLIDGINLLPGGEEIFYVSNPVLGLWPFKERF